MNPRVSVWLVSAALFAVAVAGVSSAAPEVRARFVADVDGGSDVAFKLGADALVKRGVPGESVVFDVFAVAREPLALDLAVKSDGDWRGALSADALRVVPGERALVQFKVLVPESGGRTTFGVVAVDSASGVERAIRLSVAAGDSAPRPVPCRESDVASSDSNVRCHDASKRPARCDASDGAAANSTARCHDAPQRPPFGMMLASPRASFGPGDDGLVHGRVAVLFEGGAHNSIARLSIRAPGDADWRVHLGQERVEIPAHGKAWVWVGFEAKPGAAPLHYGVVAHSADGDAHAAGWVHAIEPPARDAPAPHDGAGDDGADDGPDGASDGEARSP